MLSQITTSTGSYQWQEQQPPRFATIDTRGGCRPPRVAKAFYTVLTFRLGSYHGDIVRNTLRLNHHF